MSREQGWGLREKATRYRQAEEARRIVPPDANEPFTFKRQTQPKPQQQQQQQQQAQQQQSTPQPQTPAESPSAPAPSPPPPAASPTASATPQAPAQSPTDMSSGSYPSVSPAHARESAAPGPAPAPAAASSTIAAPARSPQAQQSNLLCSCLVELFEMVGTNPAPKAYGPKGVTLLRVPNSAATGEAGSMPYLFQLLVYAPVSKKAEFSVDVSQSFAFAMLPDRFATFEDSAARRSWCLKFGAAEDASAMGRAFGGIAEMRASALHAAAAAKASSVGTAPPPNRPILKQDLAVGSPDTPSLSIGDQVKARWSVWVLDPSAPFLESSRTKLFSTGKDARKLILGEGQLLSVGVEEALVGMRKKGVRMLVIPPPQSSAINQKAEWGPHVKADCTLVVEVSVTGVRNSLPVGGADSPVLDVQAGDDPYEEEGVYNPTNVPAHVDLKSRMAALASAQHSNGVASSTAGAPVAQPTPVAVAGRRESLINSAASLPRPASRSNSPRTVQVDPVGPSIESLLSDLSLTELLPNFKREGVTYSDLLLLDADELKTLIPQMGPRRRISGRIAELQQKAAASGTGASWSGSTPTAATPTPATPGTAASAPPAHPPAPAPSPLRPRLASSADREPSIFSPNPAQASPTVANVAARYAAAAAGAQGAHAPPAFRSRTFSDNTSEDAPPASVVAAAAAAAAAPAPSRPSALPNTHAALDALLAAEYERGKSETVLLARDKIAEIRETASARFAALQHELDESRRQNEMDRDKAREAVSRLREELRSVSSAREEAVGALSSLQQEKDALESKYSKYAAQLKDRIAASGEQHRVAAEQASADSLRAALEQVYAKVQASIKPHSILEADEVLALLRSALKGATTRK